MLDLLNLKLDAGDTAPYEVQRKAEEALRALQPFGFTEESSHALALIAAANVRRGQMRSAQAAMAKAAEHGRRSGAEYAEAASRHGRLVSMWLGPASVEDVLANARSDVAWAKGRGELRVEATGLSVVALCEAMRGRFGHARDLLANVESIEERVGREAAAGEFWSDFVADVLMLGSELSRAEARLRWVCETLDRSDDYATTSMCRLGEVAYALGRYAEAEGLAQRIETLRIPALEMESGIRWRKLLAKARTRRGERSEDVASAAVQLARSTDMTDLTAEALSDLGEVLLLSGSEADAMEALREALGLYVRKGDQVGAARIRASVDRVTHAHE